MQRQLIERGAPEYQAPKCHGAGARGQLNPNSIYLDKAVRNPENSYLGIKLTTKDRDKKNASHPREPNDRQRFL